MNGYIGNSDIARKMKNIYIGINGTARQVQKGYIGIDGVARQFYQKQNIWNRYYINYNWGKYNCNSTSTYAQSSSSLGNNAKCGAATIIYVASASSGYSFNNSNGIFTLNQSNMYLKDTDANQGVTGISCHYYPYMIIGNYYGNELYYGAWMSYSSNEPIWRMSWGYIYGEYATVTKYTSYVSSYSYSQGSYISSVSSTSSSAYSSDCRNSDGYWYVYTGTSCGSQIDSIEANPGTYPDNGISGSYWYILQ